MAHSTIQQQRYIVNHVRAMQPVTRQQLRRWIYEQIIGIADRVIGDGMIDETLAAHAGIIHEYRDNDGECIIDLVDDYDPVPSYVDPLGYDTER